MNDILKSIAGGCLVTLGVAFGIFGAATGRGGFAIACAICLVGLFAVMSADERTR